MRVVIEAGGFELDAQLEQFIRGTVMFSVWNHEPEVDFISVRLDRGPEQGGIARYRCAIHVETLRGIVSAKGYASDAWEAVQDAVNRVDVELHRSLGGMPERFPGAIAA